VNPSPKAINSLAESLKDLQRKARSLGLFTNDRELLECPACGLLEDVSSTGLLITCRAPALGEDTGLRFVQLTDNFFSCPSCSRQVEIPSSKRQKMRKSLEARQ
jgi:hypothetical protein